MQGQIQDFHKGGMVQYISAMGKNGEGKTLQDGSAGGGREVVASSTWIHH